MVSWSGIKFQSLLICQVVANSQKTMLLMPLWKLVVSIPFDMSGRSKFKFVKDELVATFPLFQSLLICQVVANDYLCGCRWCVSHVSIPFDMSGRSKYDEPNHIECDKKTFQSLLICQVGANQSKPDKNWRTTTQFQSLLICQVVAN